MHKTKPILENETHKIFWDFETQADDDTKIGPNLD